MTHATASTRPVLQHRPTSHLPGPSWYTAAQNTLTFLRTPLDFTMKMYQRYGDIVSVPTLMGPWTLVFHPDGVRHVLQENHRNYNKDMSSYHILSRLIGNGLLTNDGESWLQQRRLIQPTFHRERIASFGALMTDTTLAWLERWEANGFVDTAKPLDIPQEMAGLTLNIVCKALFGADLSEEKLERVGRALTTANHMLSEAFYLPGILSLPTPQQHRLDAARQELQTVVDELMCQQRADPGTRGDLLTLLLDARDEATGEGMTDQQARDEVLTLLLAGHETTANALAWTFYLLAQHPRAVARLQDEYKRVLQGRPPSMADLAQLPYTRMVIEEAMRLYPPAWGLGRHALADDEIGGFFIPEGANILVFPYATHRHPSFWERPDDFDPERFSAERAAGRHRFAYFPFGGGPRLCIGNQFALSEAQLILATILSRYQLQLLPTARVTPEALVTLRPRGELLMSVQRREE